MVSKLILVSKFARLLQRGSQPEALQSDKRYWQLLKGWWGALPNLWGWWCLNGAIIKPCFPLTYTGMFRLHCVHSKCTFWIMFSIIFDLTFLKYWDSVIYPLVSWVMAGCNNSTITIHSHKSVSSSHIYDVGPALPWVLDFPWPMIISLSEGNSSCTVDLLLWSQLITLKPIYYFKANFLLLLFSGMLPLHSKAGCWMQFTTFILSRCTEWPIFALQYSVNLDNDSHFRSQYKTALKEFH